MKQDESSASIDLVQRVAAHTDTDPLELPPLYDTIDPEIIDSHVDDVVDGDLSFEYAGVQIQVDSAGSIRIDDEVSPATLGNPEEATTESERTR